ncbi:MAG TPA: lysophospholipid acyltransferase family protein [Arachidicoccus sp.]
MIYYLVRPFIYLISILPFPCLYFLSDLLHIGLYHVGGYRKSIVRGNLTLSFPEMAPNEIKKLEKQYYRYLCDLFLETLKTVSISAKKLQRHCNVDDTTLQLFDRLYRENKSIIIVMGHKGNWEWACNVLALQCKQPVYVIYHPLNNLRFDKLLYRMRTRLGTHIIPMQNTFQQLKRMEQDVSISVFIADQSPSPQTAYWTDFLNQDTAFFRGPERISSKLRQTVVYASIRQTKRSHYTVHAETMAGSHVSYKQGELTEMYARELEKDIKSQPQTWLWSHRRWKHRRMNNDIHGPEESQNIKS